MKTTGCGPMYHLARKDRRQQSLSLCSKDHPCQGVSKDTTEANLSALHLPLDRITQGEYMLRDMAYLVSAGGCGCSQGQDDSMAGVVGVKAIHSGCRVVQPARIQNAELSQQGHPWKQCKRMCSNQSSF